MAEPIFLNDEQLRKLANIIYHQEVEAINEIIFTSEPDLAKYLGECKAGYESALGILDAAAELQRKYEEDNTRAPIANNIVSYSGSAINFALQFVRDYNLRRNYLNKISAHSKSLVTDLDKLDPKNVIEAEGLAEKAAQYRNYMMEYTRKYQSNASRNFSKWIKENGIRFEELVERYQAKLNYEGPFQDLPDTKKILVYEAIMEASGRGSVVANWISKAVGAAGIAVLLFNAGMLAWDIFSSERVLATATRDAVVTVAQVGGAMLDEIVTAALVTLLDVVEASALFVVTAGILAGIAGAFILGEFAGWIMDLIFGSGGRATLSTDGLQSYVAPLPDGKALAHQIAHLDQIDTTN